MELRTTKLLHDIHDTARETIEMLNGKTLEDYEWDIVLRRAVERSFGIIGGRAASLAKHDSAAAHSITAWDGLSAFGDRLIEEYDANHTEEALRRAERDLPAVVRETAELLGKG